MTPLGWERARILITVKTYPDVSHKYLETCCVAGIRLDCDPVRHVRLFPVPHRLLEQDKQFAKYNIVEVDVRRQNTDRRPESLRPNLDSLTVVDEVDTRDGWAERVRLARPLIAPSLCAIKRRQQEDGTSLGLFRPAVIESFRLADARPWSAEQSGIVNQTDIIHPDHRPLEWVPFEFRYRFRCQDQDCAGHDMGLHDWEAGQSWRRFRRTYPADRLKDVLHDRWWTKMITPGRATHFFVGNIAARPKTFMLLGLFQPTVQALEAPQQDALFWPGACAGQG